MRYPVTIVALGPGPREYLTLGALEALAQAKQVILRTGRHAAAGELQARGIAFDTLDALYEQAEDFDAFAARAAQQVAQATQQGSVCYAVADPAQDETVRRLAQTEGLDLRILPGVPLTAPLLGHLPANGAYLSVAAAALEVVDSHWPIAITEINSQALAGECKLNLLRFYDASTPVVFFAPAQQPQRSQKTIVLEDLDRQPAYDHTCCALITPKPLLAKQTRDFPDLVAVMDILRSPGGCPWDREQTHQSLRRYLIEEAYEASSAIAEEDWLHTADELGDVLLQVVFHAHVGRQYGTLELQDITSAICQKLIERHQHVFGGSACATSQEVVASWEAIKQKERGEYTLSQQLDAIATGMPPLVRAYKAQAKAAKVGFDWDDARDALKKVHEEADEVLAELNQGKVSAEEVGDLFFACVNVARLMGLVPEETVEIATKKFIKRVKSMDSSIFLDQKDWKALTLQELDVYWSRSKTS